MSFTVVTLTAGNRPGYLASCLSSVAAGMPAGGAHEVTVCPPDADFQCARWETTMRHGGMVAWVDDDDEVANDGLRLCKEALERTGAGIAFTYEERMNVHGENIGGGIPFGELPRTLRDVAMHPRMLHHLAVIRTDCLRPEVLEQADRIGIGIDWLMRAYVALKHGAVQVPVYGYRWRQHAQQESKTTTWDLAYEAAMPALRQITKSWLHHDEDISRFLPR